MSKREFYIEWTGNIQVHHPVGVRPPEWATQQEAEVITLAEYVAAGLGIELVKAA